jgi:hypothetical protein
MHKSDVPEPVRRRRSRAAQIVSSYPLLRGSLSVRNIRCGKPNCKCAEGEPHLSLYLVQSRKGKPRQFYVPKELEERVRQAVDSYQKLQELVEELSEIEWSRLEKEKAKGAKRS